MQDKEVPVRDRFRVGKLLLKIAVTLACLWWVFSTLDVSDIWKALQSANWGWLFLALLIYAGSKLIAARRLNIYFRNIGIHLPPAQNLKLYWVGMFYNLFLPGAITGDAYKVIRLSKHYQVPYRKTTAATLLDRFSGLLSLLLIASAYGAMVIHDQRYILLLILAAVAAIPAFYFFTRKWFPDFLPGFWPTFFLGAAVQLAALACVYCILFSLQVHTDREAYIFIFLVAAVASVLPISVGGGLGVREFVIVAGAKYAGLEQQTALLVSLLFYLVTVACALSGMVYVFKDPLSRSKGMPMNEK